jgi:hypothetical protein
MKIMVMVIIIVIIIIEKNLKFTIEIQCIWILRTTVVPVIIWATGTISKLLRKYVNNLPGKHDINELQKKTHWALHKYLGKYTR